NTAVATLPAGLSFSTSTGETSGSPHETLSRACSTVLATDLANGLATAAFSLTVNEALVATTSAATVAATEDASITAVTPVTAARGEERRVVDVRRSQKTAAATRTGEQAVTPSQGASTEQQRV